MHSPIRERQKQVDSYSPIRDNSARNNINTNGYVSTSNTNIIKPNNLIITDDNVNRTRGMSTTSLKSASSSPTSSSALKYKIMNETNSIGNDSISKNNNNYNNTNITFVDDENSDVAKNKYYDNDNYDYRSYDDDHTSSNSSNGYNKKYDTVPVAMNGSSINNGYNNSSYNNNNYNIGNNTNSTSSNTNSSTYNSNNYNNGYTNSYSSSSSSYNNPATNPSLGGFCERHSLEACILCSLTNKNSNNSDWKPYGNPNPIPSPNGNVGSMMASSSWTNHNSANNSRYNSPIDIYQSSSRPNPSNSPMMEYTKASISLSKHLPSSLLSSSSLASLGSVGSLASSIDFASSLLEDDPRAGGECHVHGLQHCLLCSMNNTYNGRKLNT